MENSAQATKTARNKFIHQALKQLSKIIGRNNFDIEMEKLARECKISATKFMHCFGTKEKFLQLTAERMTELFIENVTDQVKNHPLNTKDKALYFLRCVENYLNAYPEAGYLFTMSFFGNIAVNDMYHSLEHHYKVWEKTLCDCLSIVTSLKLAKRLTQLYLTSLKGQLQLADYELIPRNSYHAEVFLTQALYSIP